MQFLLYRNVLADCGVVLTPDTYVVDLGCGTGALVSEGRAAGFQTFGCDFEAQGEHLAAIATDAGYRLPYPDNTIDVVISNQVMEHVMNYDECLGELRRILKPGGAFLHMFPSRYTPIEPHVFVPGATVFQNRSWLYLRALLGVRNQHQRGMGAAERARVNHEYLRAHTNYLRDADLLRRFRAHFCDVRFAEQAFLRNSPNAKGRVLSSLTNVFPFLPWAYRTFRGKVIFGRSLT